MTTKLAREPAGPRRVDSVPSRAFDSPEQEAYLNLWRTYDRLREIEDQVFSRHELSAQQYNALRLLHAARPGVMSASALGAKLISRAPDMTRLLDKLAERGLARRERSERNRREIDVAITPAGSKLIRELAERVRDCHRRQLGHLGAATLIELTRLLQRARAPHEDPERPWPRT